MKQMLAVFLTLLLALGLFIGCETPQATPIPDGQTQAPTEALTEALTEAPTEAPAQAQELAVPVPQGVTAATDNNRVFYEIFVGSFSDSDGDGIGDLRGIINRMDYLNDGDETSGRSLGIEGIWLTPIFSSGSYHKYDVTDYYTVDVNFGTLEDLKELAELCHQRNVKLILDLPINHTSRLNSWFVKFSQAHKDGNPEDPYYDFYCWYRKGEPQPGGRTFAPIGGTDDYYECNFDTGMPELNFDNEAVRQAVLDVAKFYLDLGVDGFRFDAAKYVYFGDNGTSVDFWTWYMDQLRAIKPELYTVAEVWDGDGVTEMYYPALNCFDFTVAQVNGLISNTAQKGDVNKYVSYVQSYVDKISPLREDAAMVPFIANHDTDRAGGYLMTSNGTAQMGANLLLLGPGSPFLYYGEELGMRGSRGSANTDANRRLAMAWGDGDTVKDPEGATYPADARVDFPAADQLASPDSLYNYYKQVILLRKANPEIASGSFTGLQLSDTKVGGFISEKDGSRVLVLHNTTGSPYTLELTGDLSGFSTLSGSVGLGSAELNGSTLTLDAQTSVVLRK